MIHIFHKWKYSAWKRFDNKIDYPTIRKCEICGKIQKSTIVNQWEQDIGKIQVIEE